MVLRVEGRLEVRGAQDLERLCDAAAGGVLDVAGLRGADEAGWALLKRLKRSGWKVAGASLFVSSVLEEAGS